MSMTSIDEIVSQEKERITAYLRADMRSERTIRIYAGVVKDLLVFTGKDPADLSAADMQAFKAALVKKHGRVGQNSVNQKVCAANQYTERILQRPELRLKNVQAIDKGHVTLTASEIDRMRMAASEHGEYGQRDKALIDAMYFCALRISEAVNLKLADVDLDARTLKVNCGKRQNYDTVMLSAEAAESFGAYMRHRPTPKYTEIDTIFLNEHKVKMAVGSAYEIVLKAALEAGIKKHVHPHLLRHSVATNLAAKGVPVHIIQAVTRHRNLQTLQRYLHPTEKAVRDEVEAAFGSMDTPRAPIAEPRPVLTIEKKAPMPPLYANPAGKITRDDVLRAVLEGRIDMGTAEKMMPMVDGIPMDGPRPSKTGRSSSIYA